MIETTKPTNKAPKVLSNSLKLESIGERGTESLMIDGQKKEIRANKWGS